MTEPRMLDKSVSRGARLGFVLRLLRTSMGSRWRQYAAMAVAMAIGALSLALSIMAGPGVGRSMSRHLDSLFPARRVVLEPQSLSIIWLQVETAKITTRTLAAVRALPGVARVSPEATVRFPICARATLLGMEYGTDVTITGVESWLLGEDAPDPFVYDPASTMVMPTVLSRYFLDLYNMSLSESNNLPKLSPAAVIGRRFDLILGSSSIRPEGTGLPARIIKCKFASLSRDPDLVSLVIPLEAVEMFNSWYGITEKHYRALHVELATPEALDALREELPRLGLTLRDDKAPWQRAMVVVRLAGAGFVALGLLVFLLALGYMAQSVGVLLDKRRREMALFRALGAGTLQIAGLAATEIALACGVGIAAGLAVAEGLSILLEQWYQTLRAGWAFLPPHLFALPWEWLAPLALACWCLAIALSLKRVLVNARQDVTTTLNREG